MGLNNMDRGLEHDDGMDFVNALLDRWNAMSPDQRAASTLHGFAELTAPQRGMDAGLGNDSDWEGILPSVLDNS